LQVGTLKNDARVIDLLKAQMSRGKLTSAICAAPSVLAHAGVLEGKKHTAHFSVAEVVPDMDKTSAVVVRFVWYMCHGVHVDASVVEM
jgi:4-methyl-5(b-hydroxyethyl)-thiazole monophosphate biosynthesis